MRGVGERHLDDGMIEALKNNPDSNVVFLNDNFWSMSIVNLILQCPLEYSMNGATGLQYAPLKDFVKWATPKYYNIEKEYIPLLLNLGRFYCNALNNRKK